MVTSRHNLEPPQGDDAPRVPQQGTQTLAYKMSLCKNSVLIGDMKLSDYLCIKLIIKIKTKGDFLGGPVVRTPLFQCRDCRFDSRQRN